MKESILSGSINLITKYKNYSDINIEKMKYGLEGIYLTVTKLIIISLISILLGIFKDLIIFLLFFNLIRYPAFGFHASKSSICLITSLTLIIGSLYAVSIYNINDTLKIFFTIISTLSFPIFAPADTEKRPMTNKKKRAKRKIASTIVAIIYLILILTIKNTYITDLIFLSLLIESIMINPLTYKLFKARYNNYKLV